MALSERTRPYEYLIRINADLSIGAQKQSLTEVLRDGEVISAIVNAPEELTEAEQAAIADLIGVAR